MQGIADYEFIKQLGSGNHGYFYLARRPARVPVDVEFVAVKVMAGESSGTTFRRATRELTAFAAVRSPYLVAPYDAGQQDGIFYYSMEYLPDGSLADRPAPPEVVIRALIDAARATADLHDAGIVHRDIKPGNILLHGGGAKLSDLGLAQIFTEGVTITGMGDIGSVQFMDPAMLMGESAHPDHDVWSLAATLHHQLTRAGLYGDMSGKDGLLILRHILGTLPCLAPGLPTLVHELIAECLGPHRPTASDFANRLAALA